MILQLTLLSFLGFVKRIEIEIEIDEKENFSSGGVQNTFGRADF